MRASVPQRWLIKDLGALLFSVLQTPLNQRDLLTFIKTYSATGKDPKADAKTLRFELVDPERQQFWQQVRQRARRLYDEALRKQLLSGEPTVKIDE